MSLAVAFTGPSNSGKTTTILKVVESFQSKGYKLAIVKHDPSDKAVFDTTGKDSWKFSQLGVEVVVVSPTRTTYFSQESKEISQITKMIDGFDILIVEGLKTLSLPRIAIFRNKVDEKYFPYSNAIAVNDELKNYKFPTDIYILDLNNIEEITNWILRNGKKIEQ